MDKAHLEEIATFIREHRSNESNFEKLYAKLEEETNNEGAGEAYRTTLAEVKEKSAAEYRKAKETGGTAWPEFEKFVTEFERAAIEASKAGN